MVLIKYLGQKFRIFGDLLLQAFARNNSTEKAC